MRALLAAWLLFSWGLAVLALLCADRFTLTLHGRSDVTVFKCGLVCGVALLAIGLVIRCVADWLDSTITFSEALQNCTIGIAIVVALAMPLAIVTPRVPPPRGSGKPSRQARARLARWLVGFVLACAGLLLLWRASDAARMDRAFQWCIERSRAQGVPVGVTQAVDCAEQDDGFTVLSAVGVLRMGNGDAWAIAWIAWDRSNNLRLIYSTRAFTETDFERDPNGRVTFLRLPDGTRLSYVVRRLDAHHVIVTPRWW